MLARLSTHVTVALLTCEGGDEMHRLTASQEELDEFLAGRASSQD